MTTSRVIRGTRAKIFLYICAILIITGIIACYNNTLSQLEDVKISNENCRQHEENLSTQLQGITEYKQRLETSLKNEKAEHQKTKSNLENKLNEEKSKCDSNSNQSQIQFNSLQQHYNILQTEYDDYKEECSKDKKSQQEEINTLQAKLSELQEELKKVKASKESLKSQYLELLSSKEKSDQRIKDFEGNDEKYENTINRITKENHDLKREIEELKTGVHQDTIQEPKIPGVLSSERNSNLLSIISPSSSKVNRGALKPPDTNGNNLAEQAENQQNAFLARPGGENGLKASSSTSTIKSALKPSQASFDNVAPLKQPTVTPETAKNRNVVVGVEDNFRIPDGVVHAPEKKGNQNDQLEVEDNRYKNVKESVNEQPGANQNDVDRDNGAHEEFDNPVAQNPAEGLAFGENESFKAQEKQEKNHNGGQGENNLNKEDQELQNDVLLEENEEDDDAEGYEDRAARLKDPAVRN